MDSKEYTGGWASAAAAKYTTATAAATHKNLFFIANLPKK
jgi:hypothetical protein